jgi:hypothetical protein
VASILPARIQLGKSLSRVEQLVQIRPRLMGCVATAFVKSE